MKTLADSYSDEKTVDLVAECFDYAVNFCKTDGDDFWNYLVISGIANQLEDGNPKFVLGHSAVEIVNMVFDKMNISSDNIDYVAFERSPEYWAGWALAQYQIKSEQSYKKLHLLIGFSELIGMYQTLHEAPIEKFFDKMDKRTANQQIGLKRQRERMGLSQSSLSRISGVSLKTIQAYEQGQKDLKRAKLETLNLFADILACKIEDLF